MGHGRPGILFNLVATMVTEGRWDRLMGPQYAGVLGLIAMSTTLMRSWIHGTDLGSAIVTGVVYLATFALFGWFIGKSASHLVTESVREALIRELREREAKKSEQAVQFDGSSGGTSMATGQEGLLPANR